jgi:hypothetical protein
MIIIALLALFLFSGSVANGQNLIGFKSDEIRKFMKVNSHDMNFVKVTNNRFMYLKYSDDSESQTLLFFLSPDSVCKSVRLICDKTARAMKEKEFDTIYLKNGSNSWIDRRSGKDFLIEINDEKWSSIISMKPGK